MSEHKLDVFFPEYYHNGIIYYTAVCLYNGIVDKKCPNNQYSLCGTALQERPRNHYHPWDGRNAWKCPCG